MKLDYYMKLMFCFPMVVSNIVYEPSAKAVQLHWINNKGYFICTYFTANWYRSNEFCHHLGMELASFTNETELNFAVHKINELVQLNQIPKDNPKMFWTSGNDLATPTMYMWLSTATPLNPKLWGPGEPNNAGKEDCVNIFWSDYFKVFKLNDYNCAEKNYFICETIQC